MADTSRKRSRKSKLVPRECAVYEDDLELQLPMAKISKSNPPTLKPRTSKKFIQPPEPIIKPVESAIRKVRETTISSPQKVNTSVLKKINASSAKEDIEPKIKVSPRKFEINIEVESYDDDDDEFASIRVENRLTPFKDILGTRTRTTPISLSREQILDEADNIQENSTEVADKILSIYLRNTIGYEQKTNLKNDLHENRIQQALDEWKDWQFRSFHREDPLFYKCYICIRSWWLLSDFRHHLSSEHPNDTKVKIILEKYETHEANLIAYHERLVVINDIYTKGLCHRCGKDYAAHELGERFLEKFYKNKGCYKQFFTCMGLRDHIQTCPVCKEENKPYKCEICKLRFDSEDGLNDHLVLSHSVRSDIPIMTHYNQCKKCSERYACRYLHKCWQTGPHSECPHCFRSFSNKMSLELHMEHSNKPYECEVCDEVMTYNCKKFEHMLTHTDKYMVVSKCDKCNDLNVFLNKEDAAAHSELKHELQDTQQQMYFPKLVVPSSCVYQSLAESEMAEQESLAEEQESTQKEELVPTYEQGLNDLQESTTDFMMNDVVVKEEPEDYEDIPRLAIKEEPLDEPESQIQHEENEIDNFEHQITVKEEFIEEEEEELDEEFDGDIIKLNFDIEDLLVKQESMVEDEREEYSQEPTETHTEDDDSQEFPRPVKVEEEEEAMLEPEVIYDTRRGGKKKENRYRCTKCGFTANHKQYRAHIEYDCPKNPIKHRDYYCSKCKSTYSSMKKYLSHFEKHGYKHKACPDCLKQFDNYSILGAHVQSHIKQNFVRVKMITHAGRAMTKPDFQCKKCTKTISVNQFFEHWELHINAQPTHPIKVTSRPPQKRGELHETIIKECIARLHKMPKECNHCHRWFKRVNECKRHIIEHLLADAYNQKHIFNELKCQVCETGFALPEKYKQHMRDHASLPVYKCELCDRTFSDSSNFTKHKKVHNLRVIICDLCGKKFQSKMSLEKHIEKHKATSPITCDLCNKIFYFESTYRRHIRYYHERATHGFRCANCGHRFDTLKAKWDHMWNVHKERKQKADCPICHESFRKFSDVRAHARNNHLMEVSVLSVKKASNTVNVDKFLRDTTKIKVGRSETLVVFDSD